MLNLYSVSKKHKKAKKRKHEDEKESGSSSVKSGGDKDDVKHGKQYIVRVQGFVFS